MIKFVHHSSINLPKIKQTNINGKRHYITPDGNTYPSVTTITGILSHDSILQWRKRLGEDLANYQMILSATAGTQTHKICQEYLSNKSTRKYKKLIPKSHFNNLKPELKKINNIHALECRIYSDKYRIAGTVDCVAEYDGVLSVIDFKTTKKEKKDDWILPHYCQATAYREAWYERTGQKIDQIIIMISALDGTLKVYIDNPDNYVKKLKELVNTYMEQNSHLKKEIKNK